ncbi:MAG: hypothetical protein Q8O93_01305 [bacterium]|nr:hypothetical protein [bacterium]
MNLLKPAKKILNRTGMTLLEVMVSFSILVVAFIALTQAFPLGLAINKTAENFTKASYLAQEKLEELNHLGYDNILTGTIEAKHRLADDQNDYLYYFQRQTSVDYVDENLQISAGDTGLKKILITVYFTNALFKSEKSHTTAALIGQW